MDENTNSFKTTINFRSFMTKKIMPKYQIKLKRKPRKNNSETKLIILKHKTPLVSTVLERLPVYRNRAAN